jgi:hypothetical protein
MIESNDAWSAGSGSGSGALCVPVVRPRNRHGVEGRDVPCARVPPRRRRRFLVFLLLLVGEHDLNRRLLDRPSIPISPSSPTKINHVRSPLWKCPRRRRHHPVHLVVVVRPRHPPPSSGHSARDSKHNDTDTHLLCVPLSLPLPRLASDVPDPTLPSSTTLLTVASVITLSDRLSMFRQHHRGRAT